MAAHGEPLGAKKRLDSWKEIAAFFGRDERTVKRWEKERGLPVYRVPGSARGGVFAYSEELAEWLKAPNLSLESGEAIVPGPAVLEEINPSPILADVLPIIDPVRSGPDDATSTPTLKLVPPRSRMAAARTFLWIVPLVLIAASFLVVSFTHRQPRLKHALAAPHIPPSDAQDLYLKGRYHFEKRTADDLNQAVDFFTQSIVHDPGYAAPYVGLADTYNLLREYSVMPPQEAFPRARAAASKAVELDPTSADAHNSLAFATFWGFLDATTADREFKRAIELDPNLPRAHHWYATFLIALNRDQEAIAEIERARQLDPSSTPILADKGIILAGAGKIEEARTLLLQLTASQPDFIPSHRYLAECVYFPEGNYPGYFTEHAVVARLRHDTAAEKVLAAEQKAYARGGRQALFEEQLAASLEAFNRGQGSAFVVAARYASLGQNSEAMEYLEIAYDRHDLLLASLISDKFLMPLHGNPQFRALAAKIGFPPLP